MKLFISGASGYLGSHLVKALAQSHQVFALVRKCSSVQRIVDVLSDVTCVYVDDADALQQAFATHRPDGVIHTAALYGRKGESQAALTQANLDFPMQLLNLALQHQSAFFIHTGTSLPAHVSAYAATKQAFVQQVAELDLDTCKFIHVVLEHFFGPQDDDSKFTSYVIKQCLQHQPLALTSGVQQRDFIYIDDVVAAYHTLLMQMAQLISKESIAIGLGKAPSVRDFVELIWRESQSQSVIEFGAVPMRENELMYSCADIRRICELGWQPEHTLQQGIQATIARSCD